MLNDLAWHEGLESWKPLVELFPDIALNAASYPPIEPISPESSSRPAPVSIKPAWYDSNWAIYGALPLSVFCAFLPIGIIPLLLTKRFEKSTRRNLIIAYCIPFALGLLLKNLPSEPSNEDQDIKNETPQAELHAVISIAPSLEDGRLVIKGETNLPDLTRIKVRVLGAETEPVYNAGDTVTVNKGAFNCGPFAYRGHSLPDGRYKIVVSIPTASEQPSSVQTIFGHRGVNLRGSLVKVRDAERIIEGDMIFVVDEKATPNGDSYREALLKLYEELMEFKDNVDFHDLGFSPSAIHYKDWQMRVEALKSRPAPSPAEGIAATELFLLAQEYRRNRGIETKYSMLISDRIRTIVKIN